MTSRLKDFNLQEVDLTGRDYPTVRAVMQIVERRMKEPSSLADLSRVEADLLATATAHGVIGNGGHMYWYEGKIATATDKVAASFDRLGLPAVAEAMRASLRVFPDGAPQDDLAARHLYLSANRARLEESFRELDEVVWDADWHAAAMAYIDAHRADLASIAPEYRAALRLQ